jgi:hypothetical protein
VRLRGEVRMSDASRAESRWAVTAIVVSGMLISIITILGSEWLHAVFPANSFVEWSAKMLKTAGELIGIAAVLSFLTDRFTQLKIFKEFSEDLSRKIRNLIFEDLKSARAFGVQDVVHDVDFEELFGALKSGDELFVLLTYLTESRHDDFLKPAEAAVRRGTQLYFLVMSADSPLLAMRAEELSKYDYTVEAYKRGVQSFLCALKEMQQRLPEKRKRENCVHVVEYGDLIGSPIYLVRSKNEPQLAFSGFYFNKPVDNGNNAFFKWANVGKDSFICDIDNYVMAKWKRSKDHKV